MLVSHLSQRGCPSQSDTFIPTIWTPMDATLPTDTLVVDILPTIVALFSIERVVRFTALDTSFSHTSNIMSDAR